MIKSFSPLPYEGVNALPDYVTNVQRFTLTAVAPGGYVVTLAKLTVGESVSAGTPLAHALFESFTDHGERAKAARSRVSGFDREFIAMRGAMSETGVEFIPALTCSPEALLEALGEWFVTENIELTCPVVMSQTCH